MLNGVKNYRAVAFAGLLLALLAIAGQMVLPFVPALLWASVLSILTYPLYVRLDRRLGKVKWLANGRSESASSLVVTLATLLIICIPFLLIGLGIFLQVGGMAGELNGDPLTLDSALARVDELIHPIAQQVGAKTFTLSGYVQEHRTEIVQNLTQPIQKFAGQAGFTLLTIIFALLTQFFMLRDGRRLLQPALDLSPLTTEKTTAILSRVVATVRAVFVGTVLVAAIQGFVIGIAYWAVGVPNALLLAVVSGVLCIIPLLGAPVIYIPVGLYLFSQGKTTEALVILGVGFIVVSQIDNLIKPFLIGGQVNLHPMAIFFAILGGVVVFGPIGVMAGPMLLTVLLGMQDVLREWLGPRQQNTTDNASV
jgi:predicted PurR-regulated permease PerM